MSSKLTPVPSQAGVFIESDEQSIVFLKSRNDALERSRRFILLALDSTHLFIKASAMNLVYSALQTRLENTVWDEEGEAILAAEDAARREKRARH